MKTNALIVSLATVLLYASVGSAQTSPDKQAAPAAGAAPPATASPQSADQAKAPAAMSHMQDNMKTMQELMTKIRDTKDPAERQQLMQQHMQAMHEQMNMMRGMGMGMGGGKMGMMGPNHSPANADGMMMQRRMDMMQMMMEQMLQHQEIQEDSKARK